MSQDLKSLPYIHSVVVVNISIWLYQFSSEAVSGVGGDHLKYKYEILSDPGDQIRYPADQIRFFVYLTVKNGFTLQRYPVGQKFRRNRSILHDR